MSSIATLYIDKYNLKDNESEEKRVRSIINKIHEKDTVFCNLPFDYLAEDEQLILLHYIMTLLPERQIMANMKKTDVDRCYMNFAYENEKSKSTTKELLENELKGYQPISLEDKLILSRLVIREKNNNIDNVLKYLREDNESIIRSYLQEKNSLKMIGIKVCDFSYIQEYIDYVSNVLLQLLVYRVINQETTESLKIISLLIDKVDVLDGLIEKQLDKRRSNWLKNKEFYKNELSAEFVSMCFSNYVTHRSKFYEELNIKETLRMEMLTFPTLFGDVPSEYRAEKKLIDETKLRSIQNVIMEGGNIDEFRTKIEITRQFIDIMAFYGGRQCHSLCLQDLKVYFREIFVSKSKYKRRKAPCIVKEYINQVAHAKQEGQQIPQFNKQSQYMFVREKISRGYFREKGLSKEYIEKTSFEKKLYDLLLKQYLFYDIYESLEFIYEINNNLIEVYRSQLVK